MKDRLADDSRGATIRHIREVAAARVRNTSLRGVAREIGLSPMGLKNFINGTEPYSPTLRRLRSWYVRYAAVQSGHVRAEDATAALAVLVHDLAATPRQKVAVTVLDAVGQGYEESGITRPGWVAELRGQYDG
ncbi:MAG TPA: hypothetical protein VHG93_03105 [Longimicrobium sp.]|nr:hypothetical protein [Longimicrobium sp.]